MILPEMLSTRGNCAVCSKTRRFTKRNWVAFMIVNISELKKGNGELYMAHGNLNITMVYLSTLK